MLITIKARPYKSKTTGEISQIIYRFTEFAEHVNAELHILSMTDTIHKQINHVSCDNIYTGSDTRAPPPQTTIAEHAEREKATGRHSEVSVVEEHIVKSS